MDASFRRELARLPDRELVEVLLDHPVYHSVYQFSEGLPKVHKTTASGRRASVSSTREGWWCFYSYERPGERVGGRRSLR
jgi:hypothetical protein